MKTKTQARTAPAVALRRVAVVAAVLLMLCLVFMMPVGAATPVSDATALQDAFSAGGEITLGADITLDQEFNGFTIPGGSTVILDLNGHTISQTKECTGSYDFIGNSGTLTIKDKSGEGKISFTDTSYPGGGSDWATYTIAIRNGGSLIVEGGTIENLGKQEGNALNAIFIHNGSVIINDGTFTVPYSRTVRLWTGSLTINRGTFNGQVWVQNDGTIGPGNLIINDGTFSPRGNDGSCVYITNSGSKQTTLSITGGTFTTKIGASTPTKEGVAGSIIGGTFTTTAKENTNSALRKTGYEFVPTEDNEWKVSANSESKVAEINGIGYASLADAVAAAKANDEITVVANCDVPKVIKIEKPLTITANDEVTITGTTEAKKLFEVYANAYFENLNLINTAPAGRCIDTRTDNIEVNINNCVLTTTGTGNNQPLTVGGYDNERLTVTLSGTNINAGNAGYGITTFVPVDLTVTGKSKINGYAALYFKKDSSNSIVNVKGGSELKGENVHSGEDNSFATVVFENSNKIQLILSEEASVAFAKTSGESEAIFGFKTGVNENQISIGNGVNLEIDGEKAVFISGTPNTITIENGVTSNFKIEEGLSEDQVCVSNGENSFIVMEKPTDAVVPEVPAVTIPEGADRIIEATDGSTITPSTDDDVSEDDPITITISSSDSSAGTYDIVVSNVEKDGNTFKTTADSGLSVVQKVPQDVGDAGIKFQLSVDVKNASNALPVINPEMKEEVLDKVEEKISGDKKFHAMITAEEGNLEAVNDNIGQSKGKTVKITFTIPAEIISNPDLLVAYHVKGDAVTEVGLEYQLLDSGDYEIIITGSGFSSYVLVEEEPQDNLGGGSATDTGSGNYQYYPRSVPTDGIIDFGTSKVVTGMELPAGSDGTVTLNIKPTFTMPENGFYAFEIDAPGYNTDAKINGGLSFQIPFADLEAAGWTAEDIVLFHGTVGEDGKITWEALPTNLVKIENGVAYYKAAINGCSPFYIGFVKDGSVVNTEVVDPTVPETPEQPVTPDEPEILPPVEEPTEEPETPASPAPILAVFAGLGAVVALRRK